MSGTRGLKHLGLALLFVGACSAGKQNAATGIDFDPAGYDGFDETHVNSLTAECVLSDGNMTVTVGGGETAYIFKRADGYVVANANVGGAECITDTTKKITINSSAPTVEQDEKVIIDFYSGVFGLASGTPSAPGLVVNLGAGDGDVLKIRGTSAVDTFTLGSKDGTSYAAFQVAPATARTVPDLSMTGVEAVTVSTGAGNDTITAQGGAALGSGVGALLGSISVTFYGGDDNDTLISGATSSGGARNALKGGAGNDYFPQHATALGSDVIEGGAGIDTVDYSSRSNAVRVTVGATTPIPIAATGSFTAALKADISDNEWFELKDGTHTVRYAFQTIPSPTPASVAITVTGSEAVDETITITDGASHELTFCYDDGSHCTTGTPVKVIIGADATATATNLQTAIAAHAGEGKTLTDLTVTRNLAVVTVTNTIAGASAVFDVTETSASTIVETAGVDGFVLTEVGATPIDIHSDTTAAQVAATVFAAINDSHEANAIDITPAYTAGTAVVSLTADTAGVAGNLTIGTSNTPKFTVAGMSGGAALTAFDDGEAGEGDSVDATMENVVGGGGADIINASSSAVAHVLIGMGGNDTLTGAGLADFIYGGAGNDTLIGGAGADFLYGGAGNDTLQGGTENDTINGGGVNCVATVSATGSATTPAVPFVNTAACTSTVATAPTTPGVDTLDYSDRSDPVTVDLTVASLTCGSGRVIGVSGECDSIATFGTGAAARASVRNIRGGDGADTLTGDDQDNMIWGGDGNDNITGGAGNDTLYGEADVDTINGGDGNDYVCGGAGSANVLNGEAGLDTIDASMGTSDVVSCGEGDGDILLSGSGTTGALGTCELD